jgi:DNA polymerase-3 subunit delta'
MRNCFEFNVEEMVNGSETFAKSLRISQKSLFEYGLNMLRESLVVGFSNSVQLAIESEKAFIDNFSKIADWELIEEISKELESAIVHLERNANARIIYLDLSLRFGSIFRKIKRVKN